jgi:hypothetical protein
VLNPTNCDRMRFTGALSSTRGLTSPLETPFQVTDYSTTYNLV